MSSKYVLSLRIWAALGFEFFTYTAVVFNAIWVRPFHPSACPRSCRVLDESLLRYF